MDEVVYLINQNMKTKHNNKNQYDVMNVSSTRKTTVRVIKLLDAKFVKRYRQIRQFDNTQMLLGSSIELAVSNLLIWQWVHSSLKPQNANLNVCFFESWGCQLNTIQNPNILIEQPFTYNNIHIWIYKCSESQLKLLALRKELPKNVLRK